MDVKKNLGIICGLGLLCACESGVTQDRPPPESETEVVASAVASSPDGKAVYDAHCASCHEVGTDDAPAIDHAPSWASRSPEWSAVLKQHAVEGFIMMPARGGNPSLSESEVSAAVDYMLTRIVPPSILAAGGAEGRLFYQTTCSRCHDTGVDGAPVIGDVDAWAARSANWHTMLEQHANEGFLGMPAKGEALQLFQEDVAKAVAFMIAWSKRY